MAVEVADDDAAAEVLWRDVADSVRAKILLLGSARTPEWMRRGVEVLEEVLRQD